MPSTILAIMVEVGKLLAMNDFTDLLQKIGYARIRVEIDSSKSSKPRVSVRGKKGFFGNFLYARISFMCVTSVDA